MEPMYLQVLQKETGRQIKKLLSGKRLYRERTCRIAYGI